jgi:hypothetical protein
MPIVSRFLGIVISMYWNDHSPPHFPAKYGSYEIEVGIETGIVEGKFPQRALQHVLEWHEVHKQELLDDWQLCREGKPPKRIAPLE